MYSNSNEQRILGALQINQRIGSRIFKFALKDTTPELYPFNNNGEWAWPSFSTLTQLAASPQISALLANQFNTTFTTFVIWAYSVGLEDGYWCTSVTPADLAIEVEQFSDLTAYLMQTYAGSNMTFTLEHWEGDWAARCGTHNAGLRRESLLCDCSLT